jgi:hypothetical protein
MNIDHISALIIREKCTGSNVMGTLKRYGYDTDLFQIVTLGIEKSGAGTNHINVSVNEGKYGIFVSDKNRQDILAVSNPEGRMIFV